MKRGLDQFFDNCTFTSQPLLLALSGGPDSLFLFFYLLRFRERTKVPFYVAHVDHGWREESAVEAAALRRLSEHYEVPFFLKTLNPAELKGNLEAACRTERYAFFSTLVNKHSCQCILTGHHRDDKAETLLKQLFEGAHWFSWSTFRSRSDLAGVPLLRPLIPFTKKEIEAMALSLPFTPFYDQTNEDCRYLRARMRKSIFPWLNETFGKDVQNNLVELAQEFDELSHYFQQRLNPILDHQVIGPWGIYLDLRDSLPAIEIEIKYLLRLFCKRHGCILSRQAFNAATVVLREGKPFQRFILRDRSIVIDRKNLFLLHDLHVEENCSENLTLGVTQLKNWIINTVEDGNAEKKNIDSWRDGWEGRFFCTLPKGDYQIEVGALTPATNLSKVKKRWNQDKVPAFLYSRYPIIKQNGAIYCDFLSGLPKVQPIERVPMLRIEFTYHQEKGP